MKVLKKGMLVLGTVGLAVSLTACSNNTSEEKNTVKEKNVTVSDILNEDKERQIVMTYDTGHTDSPQIKWAGTIGDGKMDIHPYENADGFEFDQVKDLDMNSFKDSLKAVDKDYETANSEGKSIKINYGKKAANIMLGVDNENKTRGVMFNVEAEGNKTEVSNVKDLVYSEPNKNFEDGWLDIQTPSHGDEDEVTPNVLYIKSNDDKEHLKLENADKAIKKYSNVKKLDI